MSNQKKIIGDLGGDQLGLDQSAPGLTHPHNPGMNQLLFSNNFTSNRLSSVRNDHHYLERMNKFRKSYEERQRSQNMIFQPDTSESLIDDYDPSDLMSTNAIHDVQTTEAEILQLANENQDEERFFRNRRTLVNVDSRDRDQTIWPKPSKYTISLNRKFINIKEIQMRSSEFPNSEQLIRDTPVSRANNKIFWNNEGSNDVFVAAIAPGNYQPSTLQNAMQEAMNKIKRTDTDAFHEFTVSIDSVSNITSFSSLSSEQLSNPFTTVAGTSIITVSHSSHGFADGTLINISGSSAFAGLNTALVNQNQTISLIPGVSGGQSDGYTFDIGTNIVLSVNDAGGNSVRIGIGQPFKLLFSNPGTPANILGFPLVDTEFSTVHQNTVIDRTFDVERVERIDTIFSAIVLAEEPSTPLVAGESVFILGVSGTSQDALINDAAGYLMSTLTTIDVSTLGLTALEELRTVKIPVAIDASPIGYGGTLNTRTLNRPVKLAGENYIFMLSPQIGGMVNTGKVDNIFAKIDLSAPPGTILFNTFIAGPKKYDSPLAELSELTFEFRDQIGDLFDFLDSDHSFTLEIKEEIHEIGDGVGMSSQLGFRDET